MSADPFSTLESFCAAYGIKPKHSKREVGIWKLIYGANFAHDFEPNFVTFMGTFEEAAARLYDLAKRNNTFMPSSSGYSCKFQGFRIETLAGTKISPTIVATLLAAGHKVRSENVEDR